MKRFAIPSLKVTVPLLLLVFATVLSTVNLIYHIPRAEKGAEDKARQRLFQELSRLQGSLEYLLLKGDVEGAQREVAVLASHPEYQAVALLDDGRTVIAATHSAWYGRDGANVLPDFDVAPAAKAISQRRAQIVGGSAALFGYTGVLLGRTALELRPSRLGSLFMVYDLGPSKAEARSQILNQSVYWAALAGALALALWLVFHFLLTRRADQLVKAAQRLATGDLETRSALAGGDEFARLSDTFDAMAQKIARTQTQLYRDIEERKRTEEALRASEQRLQRQNAALRELTRERIGHFSALGVVFKDLTEVAAETLEVDRVSIWLYDADRKSIRCQDLFEPDTGQHSAGMVLAERDYPAYFAALSTERNIAAEDAQADPRTRDLSASYLEALGISSMLDAPIRRGAEMIGVVCHEHCGPTRRWKLDEQNFAGSVADLSALAIEIWEHRQAEEALRTSEEQYRAMFDASIDGLALWNAEGEIVDVNPALWRMHGYTREEFLTLPHRQLVDPSCHSAFDDFLRTVAECKSFHAEVTDLRKDGSALELEVHGVPIRYRGEPHVLTIARDISEKKQAAEELTRQREALYHREKLAALGSLLAGVAHELNNPLSVVVARAVLLEESDHPPTRVVALKIRTAAERCARIVRTFLAMARRHQPERAPVAINEVLEAALEVLSYGLRSTGIEVALDLAAELPLISADADQLHQVFINLIVNAQQALQDQQPLRRLRLTSQVEAGGNAIRVVVADNGPGISESVRARIFDPYFTTKPMGVGTGVGLSVSLGIVEAHGGTLTVECPQEGGAVFAVILPVGGVVCDQPKPVPVAPAAVPRNVLVVDDESEIRETLVEILSLDGHHVETAASGREALARLSSARYDAIITDIRMPDLDGCALFQEIEGHWPALASRVVFITGDTLTQALREFAREAGRPIIEKPFLPDDVRRTLAEVVGRGERSAL
ncbi:MAG: PAS domain S-box protein [Gammaproteobacteria bacterium]